MSISHRGALRRRRFLYASAAVGAVGTSGAATQAPEAFAAFQKTEQAVWGQVIRDNNLKPE